MPQYDVNNNSIDTLLGWIKSKEIAIPEIQRPFVWDASKVRDLIDSLYQGYPVGYIIIWKNPDVKLKDGSISEGKKVMIDGQQRMTALQAAILGQPVTGSDYRKKTIQIAFHPVEEKFEVNNSAIQKNSLWIQDISRIFSNQFSSFEFVMEYCKKNNRNDMTKINDVLNRLLAIKNNNLGVISLSYKLDIERVTDIFIRINSKGVVLSQADFAMSKIASNEQFGGNNIRKIIDYFCHLMRIPSDIGTIKEHDVEFSSTDYFQAIRWIVDENDDIYVPNYVDVLRVAFTSKFRRGKISDLVSLLSGRNFETREYEIQIEEDSYKLLMQGVLAFVNRTNFQRFLMIVRSTGIVDEALVRSQNTLNFAYALYLTLKDNRTNPAIIEKVVRRFMVLSMLTGRYSGSPESMFDYDIKRFAVKDPIQYLENIEEGELSDAYWNNILITRLDTSSGSSPYFHIFLMAQIKKGAKGFLSEQIDVKSMVEQRGDIHHIFPKNYLKKNGIKNKAQYNQIANYVYTQSEINIKINDRAPKEYMEEIKKQCETGDVTYGGITDIQNVYKNLEENCVPKEIFNMDIEDYPRFLELRRKLMAQYIREYYESLK